MVVLFSTAGSFNIIHCSSPLVELEEDILNKQSNSNE
jgi:hypothetical protein